jgi:molecular chaperone DnaJ
MTKQEACQLLGVSENTNQDDIKKAYKKKALETHPDRNDGVDEAFKQVGTAYRILTEKDKPTPDSYPDFSFDAAFNDFFRQHQHVNVRPNRPPSNDKDIRFDFSLSLDDINTEKEFTAVYNKSHNCNSCKGVGGEKRESCSTCKGSGELKEQHRHGNVTFESLTACNRCSGMGNVIVNPCFSCNGQGFSVSRQKITFNLKRKS